MTSFGSLAILAELRAHDARSPKGQRRLRTVRTQSLLTALETFPAGADGWREVSAETLCESARLNRRAFDLARRELIDAKLAEYRPGTHRGEKSRWRITFPLDEPPAKKVPPQSRDLPGPEGPPTVSGPSEGPPTVSDSTTVEGAPTRPGKVTPESVSGPSADSGPLTSHDTPAGAEPAEPTALEPSALKPLSRAARDLGAALAAAGATDDEIDFTIGGIKNSPRVDNPAAYMDGVVAKPGGVARLLDRTRRVLAEQDPADDTPTRPPRKPWCGNCDPDTRMIELPPDGRPMRCPDCGYAGAAPEPEPEPEPCPFGCVRGWIDADDDGPSRRCPEHRHGGRPF